ncbi:S49 family peptidase [Shinella sp. CPCC 100929]|uniref:S49 family peptidase n=2 Tax=Shinella lacus TaxID=2654216 RepID=A0ABT1R909_9HYPH|nr:S49 family peptidase [Shinella lacus]
MYGPNFESLARSLTDPKALEASRPFQAQKGERLGILNGIGRLYIAGPLFKRDSAVTKFFGFSTYEMLRRDLQVALEHPRMDAIALHIDSPGGESNGCDELAHAIFEARKKKPIAAFVSGMGCSAAYWLASATSRIVASDAAIVGSVGVVMSYTDNSKARQNAGIQDFNFVSSQSPNKGFAPDRVQKMVDDLAAVFVDAVARHRGISAEKVQSWRGGVEIGAQAKSVGMVDGTGRFEDVLAYLQRQAPAKSGGGSMRAPAPANRTVVAASPIARPPTVEEIRAKAAADAQVLARARLQAILQSPEGRALPELAYQHAADHSLTAAQVIEKLKQERIAAGWQDAVKRASPLH